MSQDQVQPVPAVVLVDHECSQILFQIEMGLVIVARDVVGKDRIAQPPWAGLKRDVHVGTVVVVGTGRPSPEVPVGAQGERVVPRLSATFQPGICDEHLSIGERRLVEYRT